MNALRFPDWQKSCELALLEADPEKLFQRVIIAETAIYRRLHDLINSPENAELQAMSDMLTTLQSLITHTFGLLDGEERGTKNPLQIPDSNRSRTKRAKRQIQPSA